MKTRSGNLILLRDAGLLLFIFFVMILFVCASLVPSEFSTLYLGLSILVLISACVTLLGRAMLSLILMGTLTSIWVSYKLYGVYALGVNLVFSDYLFIPLPLLIAGSVELYHFAQTRFQAENVLLHRQVENLVLVNELTQLYNLRALYREIPIMLRYHKRIKQPLSLMIIQLRYGAELKRMLSSRQYNELIARLAEIVQLSLRVEDKLFSIDDDGGLAILLATNKAGIVPVYNRIRSAVSQEKAFQGILDHYVEVSLRIGGREFEEEDVDPIRFKKRVESELVYDV